jgi:hypothetical protein
VITGEACQLDLAINDARLIHQAMTSARSFIRCRREHEYGIANYYESNKFRYRWAFLRKYFGIYGRA